MAVESRTRNTHGRRRSLRFRITLAATLIVTLAVVAGAGLFVVILRTALVDGVLSSTQTDAAALATRVEAAGPAVVAGDPERDGRLFQVVDPTGSVVQSSRLAGDSPLATAVSDSSRTVRIDGVPYVIVTVAASYTADESSLSAGGKSLPSKHGNDDGSDDDGGSGSGSGGGTDDPSATPTPSTTPSAEPAGPTTVTTGYIVITGRSAATSDDTIATVVRLLAVAVPLLIIFIAGTTWLTVARALRPVDRMRAELDEVTSAHLDRRIADPRSADEIGRLAVTMNTVLDRLDESQRSQRRFVSDASHELKSPLASLRQYAEVSAAHPDRIGHAELTDAVLDEGARLERLVQGMLVLAKADEQLLDVGTTPVDLDDLLLVEARRVRTAGTVTVDSSGVGPGRVIGDEGMLAQVLRNLVDNAVRHATSAISLSLTETDVATVLRVDDDGSGVAEADRDRIFERFVRLDAARARESGGSGLGLAIVAELVRAHHGTITVGAGALGGARFELTFPSAP